MKQNLRIAILDRIDSGINPGGDTKQITETYKYLCSRGYNVSIFNELFPDLRQYDLAFVFNLTRYFDCLINVQACLRYEIPYILFPVYWDFEQLDIPSYDFISAVKKIIPVVQYIKFPKYVKNCNDIINQLPHEVSEEIRHIYLSKNKVIDYILENAFFICPNSKAEMKHLVDNYKVKDSKKFKVIYNGIADGLYKNAATSTKKDGIICVGGIGPRKNQLNLAKASYVIKTRVRIIGKSFGQERYMKSIHKYDEYIDLVGPKDYNDIISIMSKSAVHIQPSYIETPGLASMEAYACGCRIIVSDVAPVKEYFGDNAMYVDPYSVISIMSALENSKENQYKYDIEELKQFNERYSWENVLAGIEDILHLFNTRAKSS